MLLNESVTPNEVVAAIDGHNRVIVGYIGEDGTPTRRIVDIYAYGITIAGNPVIRVHQRTGGSFRGGIPDWRYLRLDRITDWRPTKQTFDKPASDYNPNIGRFNSQGDKTMAMVYKVARFDSEDSADSTHKTDTEMGMERLRKQLDNPITLQDYLGKDKEAPKREEPTRVEPVKPGPKLADDVYKTDTEMGMERLRKQLDNPITLQDYFGKNKSGESTD